MTTECSSALPNIKQAYTNNGLKYTTLRRDGSTGTEEIPAGSIDDSVAPSIDGEQEGNAAE